MNLKDTKIYINALILIIIYSIMKWGSDSAINALWYIVMLLGLFITISGLVAIFAKLPAPENKPIENRFIKSGMTIVFILLLASQGWYIIATIYVIGVMLLNIWANPNKY